MIKKLTLLPLLLKALYDKENAGFPKGSHLLYRMSFGKFTQDKF